MIKIGSQLLNFEERFSSFLQTEELEILNSDVQLKDLFNLAIGKFNEIYHFANQAVDKMKSKEFSVIVRNSETLMLVAERISKIIVLDGADNQIAEVKNKFEELFNLIPLGPSILFKRDIDNVRRLSKRPENLTYNTKYGEFYEPQVSIVDITNHFQVFCVKNNYISACVTSKTDEFFGTCLETMFTIISFRKKKENPSKLTKFLFPSKESIQDKKKQLDQLNNLLTNIRDWGYDQFFVIHVEDLFIANEKKHQKLMKNWGWSIFLYHKRVENANQLVNNHEFIKHEGSSREIKLPLLRGYPKLYSLSCEETSILDRSKISNFENTNEKPLVKTKNKRSKSLKVTLQHFFKAMYLSIKSFIMRLFQWIKNRHQK